MEAAAAAPRHFAGLRNLRATLASLWEACATGRAAIADGMDNWTSTREAGEVQKATHVGTASKSYTQRMRQTELFMTVTTGEARVPPHCTTQLSELCGVGAAGARLCPAVVVSVVVSVSDYACQRVVRGVSV